MHLQPPKEAFDLAPGRLLPAIQDDTLVLYLREDLWGLKKYAPSCPLEIRLLTWDIDDVLVAVLLARLGRNDLTTYEAWLDLTIAEHVRFVQYLSVQNRVDLYLLVQRVERSFRYRNELLLDASQVLNTAHAHPQWSREQFEKAQLRISQLFPLAKDLWWSTESPTDRQKR